MAVFSPTITSFLYCSRRLDIFFCLHVSDDANARIRTHTSSWPFWAPWLGPLRQQRRVSFPFSLKLGRFSTSQHCLLYVGLFLLWPERIIVLLGVTQGCPWDIQSCPETFPNYTNCKFFFDIRFPLLWLTTFNYKYFLEPTKPFSPQPVCKQKPSLWEKCWTTKLSTTVRKIFEQKSSYVF